MYNDYIQYIIINSNLLKMAKTFLKFNTFKSVYTLQYTKYYAISEIVFLPHNTRRKDKNIH